MLLQILEDSRLTDNTGRVVSFKNTVIIMTSNVGAKLITDKKKLGFVDQSKENQKMEYESTKKEIMQELKREFSPEFINRIDEIIVFNKLEEEDLEKIVNLELQKLMERLEKQGVLVDIDESVKKYIVKQDIDKNYGARPIKRAVQSVVEDNITDAILDRKNKNKCKKDYERRKWSNCI